MAPLLVVGRQGEAIHPDQLPLNMPDVSSSEIRQRARQGESLNGFVPHAIAALLAEGRSFN